MGGKTDVFFSYHTESSGALVRKAAAALEEKGIRCWYCQRDGKGAYAHEIMRAIRECRVFILIANDAALRSEDCLNEIELGFDRMRQVKREGRDDFTILPFKTQDVDLADYDAAYYLKRFAWTDAAALPEEEQIPLLIQEVCPLFSAAKTAVPQRKAGLKSVFQYPKKAFVGRETELDAIAAFFEGGAHCVALQGMGGIGKSEIAKFYAVSHKDDYSAVVFAPLNKNILHTVIDDSVFQVADVARQPDETDAAYFERKLSAIKRLADETVLFVIDGFDDGFDEAWKAFCAGSCRILITTRRTLLQEYFDVVPVESFALEEALRLFETYYGKPVREVDKKLLGMIFGMLRFHTLAIEIVAKQMRASRLDAKKMYSVLKDSGFYYDIPESVTAHGNETGSAAQIIAKLFNLAQLNENERYILSSLALLPEDGILIRLLKEISGLPSYEEINSLIGQSWIQTDEELDKATLHPLIRDTVIHELQPSWPGNQRLIQSLTAWMETQNADDLDDEETEELTDLFGTLLDACPAFLNGAPEACMRFILSCYQKHTARIETETKQIETETKRIERETAESRQATEVLKTLDLLITEFLSGGVTEAAFAEAFIITVKKYLGTDVRKIDNDILEGIDQVIRLLTVTPDASFADEIAQLTELKHLIETRAE